jgi:hypothetical protein
MLPCLMARIPEWVAAVLLVALFLVALFGPREVAYFLGPFAIVRRMLFGSG